ncbi:endothelial lipase [Molossus molossus]|uniref:Endothelial lipase n=1 Tax=Molossus molossus TaxID=27622 RepID=A0A7J8HGU5_MOLMO|nr:endothelial lipase [Molossus molossus]KAF6471506.1 lipase G, endothelial type [Molossus molossus]
MRNSVLLLCLWSVYCCFAAGGPALLGPEGPLQDELNESEDVQAAAKPSVRFNLRISEDPEHEGCYLSLGHNQSLEDCGFNMTAKTFFIIHGWTMSGILGKWLYKLVSALQTREKEANVVVVDWLPLAHQLYTDAVNNVRMVGHSIARMLDWLQEQDGFSLGNVHLIGYSLGAHVAGYAGNFVKGTVGRITGLDPAGPMFEGVDIHSRLSPDDADFVDVLHTYTRSFGLSIGIQMPVGHIDIYPNGGDFQPGCGLNDVLGSIAYGTIAEGVKCEHERAIYLFVDSLMNQDKPSFAFQCTDSNRFKKGICLSCRKNRCNSIGYNTKRTRNKRNSKMYLKTRAGMPFRVYHYQMKIHVFSYKNMTEINPIFYVTLYGTNADSQMLPLEIVEQIGLNATNTFLVYTEEDLGDLLKIRLTWKSTSESWYGLWDEFRRYLSQSRKSEQEVNIRRIRVKSGETQRKFTFCAEDPESTSIAPGQELWFRKCLDSWRTKNETRHTLELL